MEKNLAQKTMKNSFWNFSSSLVVRIGSLIFTILLARFLLPEGFGIYNLVFSIAFLFMTFFHSGINESLLRYISESLGKNDKRKTKSYFQYLFRLKLIISGAFSALLILLAYPLSFYIFKKPIIFLPLILSAGYIFLFSFEGFLDSLFFALKKVKYLFLKEIFSQSLKVGIILAVFFIFTPEYYILGIIAGLIITAILILALLFYLFYHLMPYLFQKGERISKKDKGRIIHFVAYLLLGGVSFAFFGCIDVIMLGLLIEDAVFIGYYRSAFILVSSLGGLMTFSYVLLPVLTQMGKDKIENAFNRIFRYNMIASIPAAFGVAILSKYIIRLIYGYDYLEAALPLYFLSSLIVLGVMVALFLSLFSALEKPRIYLPLLIGIIILNVLLNYILITTLDKYSLIWATTGAGIATVVSWIIYSIGLGWLAYKHLDVKTDLTLLIKPTIASLIMALGVYSTLQFVPNMNILSGIFEVMLGVLIYSIIMLLIKGIVKEDLLLFKSILRRK
ncbi:MAG: oligosaccharide flippase family protein [Nanoarchaeota archaeon]|nr:oligosaccharide flippase family protein [Nanoarchaeota archaeon]